MDDEELYYTIFIVEDDEGLNNLIKKKVTRAGYRAVCVQTGKEAIERIRNEQDVLLLLDYKLPDMSGKELISQLTSSGHIVPFIVMTGFGDEKLAVEMMKLGARHYIVKDVGYLDTLIQIIERTIIELENEKKIEKAEKSLRKSEERLKEAQTIGKMGNWEFDISTNQITWSDEVYTLYERDKALGPPTPEEEAGYYLPHDAAMTREYAKRAIENGEEFEYDLTVMLPSKRKAYFTASMRPKRNKNNEITNLYGTIQDITERKKAEEALRESDKEKSLILDNMKELIVYRNMDFETVWASKSASDYLGLSHEEMVGRICYKARHGTDSPCDDCYVFKSMNTGKVQILNTRSPDGKYWHVIVTPVVNDEEQIMGTIETSLDVTNQREAELNLAESEEKFRRFFEDSRDAVYITDVDGIIIDINVSGCQLFDYNDREEMIGLDTNDFFVNPEEREVYREIIGEKGFVRQFEVKLRKKDGTVMDCQDNSSLRIDENGNMRGYQGIIHDVTERKIAEKRLIEEFTRAEFYNDLMSHDINNFNQGAISNLELLLMARDVTDHSKKYITNALNHTISSTELISNLRKLREIKGNGIKTRDIDAIPIFQDAADRVKTTFPNKVLKVKSNLEGLDMKVKANELLFDVFYNFLNNSVKFNKDEVVEIDVAASENNGFWKFVIMDRGMGIDDSMKERIFDRFSTNSEVQGTGLGLTIVREIINSYGGKVWVEDRIKGEQGEGSNFIFEIPKGV